MHINTSILYSNEFEKVMRFLFDSPSGIENFSRDFFSKGTALTINSGFISSKNISIYIESLIEMLKQSKGNKTVFDSILKSAITSICTSPVLNKRQLDALTPAVEIVINDSYDFGNSAQNKNPANMYRGWTGGDLGSVASSFLSNKLATIENFQVVIRSYIKILLNEFRDFGASEYKKKVKIEFQNESVLKSAILKPLEGLPLSERAIMVKGCLSILDEIGCELVKNEPDFIASSSIFSDFIEDLQNINNQPYEGPSAHLNRTSDEDTKFIVDFLSNITSQKYDYNYLHAIDFRLIDEKHYQPVLKGLLNGVKKCQDALNSDFSDENINQRLEKSRTDQLITTLLIRASTLMQMKGFSKDATKIVLDDDIMKNLVVIDKNQALIIELCRSMHWDYSNIIKHWDFLMEAEELQSVIDSSLNLSEYELESIHGRFLLEDTENVVTVNFCTGAIIDRLYQNHYAPKLISGVHIPEYKLAPIMANLLYHAQFRALDVSLFERVDLQKVIKEPNYNIQDILSKPYSANVNEMITSAILNKKISEVSASSLKLNNSHRNNI